MEHVFAANVGRARRVKRNGREYLVADATLLPRDGVLNGSKGPLFYPWTETLRSVRDWDGVPLTFNHPTTADNSPTSAQSAPEQWLGFARNSRANGKLVTETWFDVEKVRAADREHGSDILNRLEEGGKIELSTGLYTENEDRRGVSPGGRQYEAVAKSYSPDHIAILPFDRGACSVEDGCGVNNSSSLWRKLGELLGVVNAKKQPSEELDMADEKACKILHDGEVHEHELTDDQRKMFGAKCGHTHNVELLSEAPDRILPSERVEAVTVNGKRRWLVVNQGRHPESGRYQGTASASARRGGDHYVDATAPVAPYGRQTTHDGRQLDTLDHEEQDDDDPDDIDDLLDTRRDDHENPKHGPEELEEYGRKLSITSNSWGDEAREASAAARKAKGAGGSKMASLGSSVAAKKSTAAESASDKANDSSSHEDAVRAHVAASSSHRKMSEEHRANGNKEASYAHDDAADAHQRAIAEHKKAIKAGVRNAWSDAARKAAAAARRGSGGLDPNRISDFNKRIASAEKEGVKAHLSGKAKEHNPHEVATDEHHAWELGRSHMADLDSLSEHGHGYAHAFNVENEWSDAARKAAAEARKRGFTKAGEGGNHTVMENPDGHRLTVFSNGEWRHSGQGKTKEGKGVSELKEHLTTNFDGATTMYGYAGGGAHGASKDAAAHSVMSEHEKARGHALSALDHSGDGNSKGAAGSHVKAAEAHEAGALEARKDKDNVAAEAHDTAAAAHRKAASMHSATLNKGNDVKREQILGMDRDQLLVLVTNRCKCTKEKAAYPELNTATLRAIALNTSDESGGGDDTEQAGDEEDGDDPEGYRSKKGKGLEHGHKVGQKKLAAEDCPSMNQWMQSAPPEVREAVQNAAEIVAHKKHGLVQYLVANVQDDERRKKLVANFMQKGVKELEEMVHIVPRQVASERQPTLYFGGAGGADMTANADDAADDVLELPTINYKEIAEEQRKQAV